MKFVFKILCQAALVAALLWIWCPGAALADDKPAAPPPPAPGMPSWARPGGPAPGPTIELAPDDSESNGDPGAADPKSTKDSKAADRSRARGMAMNLIDRVRGMTSQINLGGYGEFVFHKYPGQDSAFEARRFVLFLYAPVLERISLATEIEWEHGGTPLRRDGQLALGEVLLEFAVVDVKLWEFLTLRAGILLMPVGRLNVNHDAPSLEFTDRPLVNLYIIPSTWWEAGAGLTGRIPLGPLALAYELYAVNGLTSAISDSQGLRAARGSVLNDNNGDKALTGRLSAYYYSPRGRWVPQAEVGLSGYTGAYDRGGSRLSILAADLLVRNAYLELAGEYARAFIDPGFDDDYAVSTRLPVPTAMQGFYIEARGRLPLRLFAPRLSALPAWLGEASIALLARYEEVDTDLSVVNQYDQRRLSLGANLRLSAAFLWKHELQLSVNDAGGARREVFQDPGLGYVSSAAFLF
jgi:hypothetical protein